MTKLNYETVNEYWRNAQPSILGPYMMDGFGFPAAAGQLRFRAEIRIMQRLIRGLNKTGTVLDLGSGIGYWAEHFARHFEKVVAVEASAPLYEALKLRCASFSNVETHHGDVLQFEPVGQFKLVFLGGLLMYLNQDDAIALLRRLALSLEPGGVIVCRETTVRNGAVTREGDYQAVYRSTDTYMGIFNECGLSVVDVKKNTPYVLMQMGCEFMKKWKVVVPNRLQMISVVGHLLYYGLRLGYPWIVHVPGACRWAYPQLTNHFFVLQLTASVADHDPIASAANDPASEHAITAAD